MEVTITGKQLRVTELLRRYIHERAGKAQKYLSPSSHLVFTLKAEKYRQIAEAHLNMNGLMFQAEGETEKMQTSVDQVMAKLERQLNRYKEKLSDHRVRPAGGRGGVISPVGRKKETDRVMPSPPRKKKEKRVQADGQPFMRLPSVERETLQIEILTLEEAVAQMTSDHKPFLLFRNRSDQRCHLLYRRENGPLALIEGVR